LNRSGNSLADSSSESSAVETQESLGASALIVSSGTLLSRIFGLVRDVVIATIFGASRVTDVFFLAYRIPSLFRKLLAEGALSSAIVPVYVDIKNDRSPADADTLASAAFTWTILLVGTFVGLAIIGAPLLVSLIGYGLEPRFFDRAVFFTRVMFPFLLMMSAAAVVMGVSHARKQYTAPAYAPVCLNVALVVSALLLVPYLGDDPWLQIRALVVGVLIGGFFQFYVQWQSLSWSGLRLRWNPNWRLNGLWRILKMMGPMVAGLSVTQLIVLVDTAIASFLNPGNISHLYYSNRLFQFPFGLVGIALGTVVLPTSSEQVNKSDLDEVVRTTRESLGMMTFLMIPSAAGLALIGRPLIGVLFRRQQFTELDQSITTGVLLFALIGLVAYGFIRIFVSLCYSFEDTTGPLLAALAALGVNACLDVLLVWVWPGNPLYRVCALTLAGSVAVWVQVVILRRRMSNHLSGFRLIPWVKIRRHLALTAVMAIALIPVVRLNQSALLRVSVGTTLGAGIYFILAYLMGDPYPVRVGNAIMGRLSSEES
jgi:putative peptidoglycan lipid II flippase